MHRVCCCAALAGVLLVLPALGQAQEIVVPATQQGTLICATGDTILLAGPDTVRDFYQCVLSADRHVVPGQQQNSNPNNPRYAFRWVAGAPGTHRLSVDYVMENRSATNGRRLLVQVQGIAPVVLNALPTQFYGASQGKDLPVSVQIDKDFHATKVDYYLDGVDVGSVSSTPFGFTLPLGGVLTGPHQANIAATDASGDVYISPLQTVDVMGGSAPRSVQSAFNAGKPSGPSGAIAGAHKSVKAKKGAAAGKHHKR